MTVTFELEDITIELVRKRVRHVSLRVLRAGEVRITAPLRVELGAITAFARSKLAWIRKHRARLREQPPVACREYVDGERHDVWGTALRLGVLEMNAPPRVLLESDKLVLCVRPGADAARRKSLLVEWHREQVRAEAPTLIRTWEPRLSVAVSSFAVRRMKTRWGTCNIRRRSILLSTELATKPRECLEYVVVHEMVHLLEPSHNARFAALMDRFLPRWRQRRQELNRH